MSCLVLLLEEVKGFLLVEESFGFTPSKRLALFGRSRPSGRPACLKFKGVCDACAGFAGRVALVSKELGCINLTNSVKIMKYFNSVKKMLLVSAQLMLISALAACGGGGGGGSAPGGGSSSSSGGGSAVDTSAPTATIQFPPAFSATESASVTVRGTASDAGDIAVVRVNGVDAISTDNFANWSATIPLTAGSNTITVETGDTALNADASAATAVIQYRASFLSITASALDAANNRMLVVDQALRGITAVDLDTGARTVLSSPTVPSSANALFSISGVAVDGANNRALVVGMATVGLVLRQVIMAVDLTSGARTVFSENSMVTGTPYTDLIDIAIDSTNGNALVLNRGASPSVVEVSLADGSSAVVRSSNTVPSAASAFTDPVSITVSGDRAYIVDGGAPTAVPSVSPALIDMRLSDGLRSTVSSNISPAMGGPVFDTPVDVKIDGDYALVTDYISNHILAVRLETNVALGEFRGQRWSRYNNILPSSAPLFNGPLGLELTGSGSAIVVNFNAQEIVEVNLSSGTRSLFASNALPDNNNPFENAQDVVLDRANNRAYVLQLNTIHSVNLLTGERSILSSPTVPDTGNALVESGSMVLDSTNNRLLVTERDSGGPGILAVNLTTGVRTPVSNNGSHGAGDAYAVPLGIALDNANNRVFITDTGLDAVYAVDLTSGDRTLVSSDARPDTANSLNMPTTIVLNADNTIAYVLDTALAEVIEVDLSTGARTIKSGSAHMGDAFVFPTDMVLAQDIDQLLIADFGYPNSLLAVDLATGDRSLADGNYIGASGFWALALDEVNNQVLIMDNDLNALVAFDLVNGNTVVQSMNQ